MNIYGELFFPVESETFARSLARIVECEAVFELMFSILPACCTPNKIVTQAKADRRLPIPV